MNIIIYGVFGCLGKYLFSEFYNQNYKVFGVYNEYYDDNFCKKFNSSNKLFYNINEIKSINHNIVINCIFSKKGFYSNKLGVKKIISNINQKIYIIFFT